MKSVLFLFFLLYYQILFYAQTTPNCKVVIELEQPLNKHFGYIQLGDGNGTGNEYYIDTVGNTLDSICLYIDEPDKFSFFFNNNDLNFEDPTPNFKTIWLYEGEFKVKINTVNYALEFQNSELNIEAQKSSNRIDSLRKTYNEDCYFKKNDSIRKTIKYDVFKGIVHPEMEKNRKIIDSIEAEIANIRYEYFFKMPNSYLTLDFLSFYVDNRVYFRNHIAYDKLKILFNTLGTNLHQYKRYKFCESFFKNGKPKPIEVSPKPLWNGN